MDLRTSHRMAERSTLGLQCEGCHWKPGRLGWQRGKWAKRGGSRGAPLGSCLSHPRQRDEGTVGYLKGLDSECVRGVGETLPRQLRDAGVDSDLGALLKSKMVVPLTQVKETAGGLDCGGVGGKVLSCLWKDGVGSTVCGLLPQRYSSQWA